MPVKEISRKHKDGTITMIPVGRTLTDEEVKDLGITRDMRRHGTGIGTVQPDDAAFYEQSSGEGVVWDSVSTPAQPSPQATQEAVDASELDLQELIGGSPDIPPQRVVVEVNSKPVAFHIKRLDAKERNRLEGRKYRRVGSQVEALSPDVMDTVTTAWMLHDCVVKADGFHHWEIEQLLGRAEAKGKKGEIIPAVPGLLEMNSPHIDDMIADLRKHIYAVNPRLDPSFLLAEMGLLSPGNMSGDESEAG